MAEDRTIVPDWLDQVFIQKALRKGMKNPCLEIVKYQLAPATAVGDNYGSVMLRATSIVKKQENGPEEPLSFVIKFPPQKGFSEFIHEFKAFEKEGKMFCQILPETNDLLRKAFPNDESVTALGYGYEPDPVHVVFLEDLKASGYEKGDRLHRSEWAQCKLVLKALARYHASSYVHIQNRPEIKEFYNDFLWDSKKNIFLRNMLKNAYEGLASLVETWEDSPEKERYRNKFEKLAADGPEKAEESYIRNDNVLNTLLHGDCWISNYMFKYDENRTVIAAKLVDLQIVTYNTPVLDVIHFIFSSTSDDVRLGDPERFLRYYHECFMTTLKNLNFNLQESFTFEDLKKEYYKRLFFAVTVLCFIFPMIGVPQSEVLESEDMIREGGANHLYKNKALTCTFKKALKLFEEHGVF